uniref:Uncharacterized protein n=1 Tax=Anguilla anguilla TaxID=7936 RepID=A0A0E9SXW3_ANGAN
MSYSIALLMLALDHDLPSKVDFYFCF